VQIIKNVNSINQMTYQTDIGRHDGDSWEELCHMCLKIRLREAYVEVPGSSGDFGIDGYTVNGEVYQCYCPERACSDKELYESQREKITKDIEKLNTYKTQLQQLFNGIKIKRWFLLTPKITNHNLIKHCNAKTNMIKDLALPFIDDDFMVLPLDYKHISGELETALNVLDYTTNSSEIIQKIDVPSRNIDEKDISNYKNDISKNEQTNNAKRKHTALFPKDGINREATIVKRVDRTVSYLLIGDSILKDWEVISQQHLEKFNKIVKLLESQVEELCELPAFDNQKQYNEIRAVVKNAIDAEFKALSEAMRMQLTERVIADWLLRCPLNFE
jgi:hypothetical protein